MGVGKEWENESNLFCIISSFKSSLKNGEWGVLPPEAHWRLPKDAKLVILDRAIGRWLKKHAKEWKVTEVK